MKIFLLLFLIFFPQILWADSNSSNSLPLEEEQNGTNAGRYRTLQFSNGTTTNNNDGSIYINNSSGGGGSNFWVQGNQGIGTTQNVGIGTTIFNSAFTVQGQSVVIASKPSVISSLSNTNFSGAGWVKVKGNYDYMTADDFISHTATDSFNIIDTTQKNSSPVLVKQITDSTLNGAEGLCGIGNIYYVVSIGANTVDAIDVTNPTTASIVGSLADATNLNGAEDIDCISPFGLVVNVFGSSIAVVRISDPTQIHLAASNYTDSHMANPEWITHQDGVAYVTNAGNGYIHLLDISKLPAISLISATNIGPGGSLLGEAIDGRYGYFADNGLSKIYVVDFKDKANPSIVTTIIPNFAPWTLRISGNTLYVTYINNNAVGRFDITNRTNPIEMDDLVDATNLNTPDDVFLDGTYAHIATNGGRLTILNLNGFKADTITSGNIQAQDIRSNSTMVADDMVVNTSLKVGTNGIFTNGIDSTSFTLRDAPLYQFFKTGVIPSSTSTSQTGIYDQIFSTGFSQPHASYYQTSSGKWFVGTWSNSTGTHVYSLNTPDTDLTNITSLSVASFGGNVSEVTDVTGASKLAWVTGNGIFTTPYNLSSFTSCYAPGAGALGSVPSITNDGTYYYVTSYTSPAHFYKILISNCTVSNNITWTGINNGHNIKVSPDIANTAFATNAGSEMAKINTSAMTYSQIAVAGTFTDDMAFLGGNIYLGREDGSATGVKVNESAFTSSTWTQDPSFGMYTDGTNLFSVGKTGYFTYYPNADTTKPYRYFFNNRALNELGITNSKNLVVTDFQSTISDVFRIQLNALNVGIGTANPAYNLEVKGNAHIDGITSQNITVGSNTGVAKLTSGSIGLAVAGTDYVAPAGLSAYVPYTGATGTVNLNSQNLYAGNIGIGSTSPRGALDVHNNSPLIDITNGNITQTPSGGNFNDLNGYTLNFTICGYKTINGVKNYSTNCSGASYREDGSTNDTYYLTLTWTQNNSADGYKFIINDNPYHPWSSPSNQAYQLLSQSVCTAGTCSYAYGQGNEGSDIGENPLIQTPILQGANFYIDYNTGNIGINTSNAISNLAIFGNVGIGTLYAGSFSAPKDGIIVQGNVGIGTWSPSVKLEIEGGNIGIGTFNTQGFKLYNNGSFSTDGNRIFSDGSGGFQTNGLIALGESGQDIQINSSNGTSGTTGGTADGIDLNSGSGGNGSNGNGGSGGTYNITSGGGGTTTKTSAGIATGGVGGTFQLNSGGGGDSNTNAAGSSIVTGGAGATLAFVSGGGGSTQTTASFITSGTATGGRGGVYSLQGGAGGIGQGSSGTNKGGAGGNFTILGGAGGEGFGGEFAGGTTATGGTGGQVLMHGGVGGSALSASTTNTPGIGGAVILQPGLQGGGGVANGTDILESASGAGQLTVGDFGTNINTNIGIGTSVPTSRFQMAPGIGNVGIGTFIIPDGGTNNTILWGNVGIGTTKIGGNGEGILSINGNVGIGTWVPSGILDIQGGNVGIGTQTISGNFVTIQLPTGTNNGLSVNGTNVSNAVIIGNDNGSGAGVQGQSVTGYGVNGITNGGTNYYEQTATSGSGITSQCDGGVGSTCIAGIFIGPGTTTGSALSVSAGQSAFSGGNFKVSNSVGSTWAATFTGTKLNVGIGSLSPGAELDVVGNARFLSSNIGIGTALNLNSRIEVFGGNVGLGTINPGQLLDVQGNIRISQLGSTLSIATGSNACAGTGTLSGGTVTISTTCTPSTYQGIFISDGGGGVFANIGALSVGTVTGGTSFIVNSANVLDSSNFSWEIHKTS